MGNLGFLPNRIRLATTHHDRRRLVPALSWSRQEIRAAAAAPAASANADVPLAPGTAGDFKLYNTDPRDAAMVMAIVADELQKPLNELRFISIREITPKED